MQLKLTYSPYLYRVCTYIRFQETKTSKGMGLGFRNGD